MKYNFAHLIDGKVVTSYTTNSYDDFYDYFSHFVCSNVGFDLFARYTHIFALAVDNSLSISATLHQVGDDIRLAVELS